MKKIAIQEHPTKGKNVIKILESLGGINRLGFGCMRPRMYYYVDNDNYISYKTYSCVNNEYTCYTLEEYEQKFLNIMEKRNIQIDFTTAKEWYKQGGDLQKIALQAFSENELQELPISWEEYCEINPYLYNNKDVLLLANGNIMNSFSSGIHLRKYNPFVISSQKRAAQFVVLNKLLQIRDYYNQGWEPDWHNRDKEKYVITTHENVLYKLTSYLSNYLFAFKTKELRDEFYTNFKEDLKFIKEFL